MKQKILTKISLLLIAVTVLTACANNQRPGSLQSTPTGSPSATGTPSVTPDTDGSENDAPSVTPTSLTPPITAEITPQPTGNSEDPEVSPEVSPADDPLPTANVTPVDDVTPTANASPTGTASPTEGGTPHPVSPGVTATPTPTKAVKDTPTPKPTQAPVKDTPTPTPTKAPIKNTPTPTPTKKPTKTPTPTPTPEPVVWDEPWDEAVCRDDIAQVLMQKVNEYRVSKGVPAYEDPYDYEDIKPGLGDRLTEKAHRVAKRNVKINSAEHEASQIGTVVAYYMTGSDSAFVETIAEEAFLHWYNSKAHNANMLDDNWSPFVGVAVMAVYEWYDGIFYYYACIMGVTSTATFQNTT